MTTTVIANTSRSVGQSIPPFNVHGISVSLPTWRDNIDYEEGEARVLDKIRSAYPRFKIHYLIEKLEGICQLKFGQDNEKCHLYPTLRLAEECRLFMHTQSPDPSHPVDVRIVEYTVHPPQTSANNSPTSSFSSSQPFVNLYIVFFKGDGEALGKAFWQHTGAGISSRVAEYCLSLLSAQDATSASTTTKHPRSSPERYPSPPSSPISKPRHRHYSSLQKGANPSPIPNGSVRSPDTSFISSPLLASASTADELDPDWSRYLEERYARNLPVSEAPRAKRALRRRIAGVLVSEKERPNSPPPDEDEIIRSSPANSGGVTENDVYLFPSGMCAIWYAHRTATDAFPSYKSVCFGFPYTDTYKILQKWGPGCHFFGRGSDLDVIELEKTLKSSQNSTHPIRALFCEFPSNPLLRSPPLVKLRELADRYDFIIVVDETIASFANVEVLPFADIIVSSLSKVFSGETNVLGGSLVLNPQSRHYHALKSSMDSIFEDFYWIEDAVFMERNSRDFAGRVRKMNRTTETLCEYLRSRSLVSASQSGTPSHAVVKEVFYPKFVQRESYDECRIGSPQQIARSGKRPRPLDPDEGGYGMLFTLTFTSEQASEAFYDALPTHKGPSLGTNFTLASPYAILAHYTELEWAAQFGVERSLVRISVGLEDSDVLISWFGKALDKAEEVTWTSAAVTT